MIKSMTGYGSSKGTVEGLEIQIELKSVNNRFLDASVRLPRSFLALEEPIKSAVQKHISRGKVDVFVNVNSSAGGDLTVRVNETLLKGYLDAINHIADEYSLDGTVNAFNIARFPDVLSVEKRDLDTETLSAGVESILSDALLDFDAMRRREGMKLREDVLSRLETIECFISQVEEKAPETVAAYRRRLEQKMAEVLGTSGIDENRILAEAALFADHIATDEETVRLRSHLSQFRSMLVGDSPVGRKLDFLVQECNREANTIGSKCQNSEIAHVVVDMKSEIEKIREQIQNIE